jgi:hypothetical protein
VAATPRRERKRDLAKTAAFQEAGRAFNRMTLPPFASLARTVVLTGALLMLLGGSGLAAERVTAVETNVALHVIPREILFFSAQAGQWTSIRLDPGERILQRGADGNVAAVVTSRRAFAFSAALNVADEINLPPEETLESFQAEGNVITLLTRRRAIGFSAAIGRWSQIERFQLGR